MQESLLLLAVVRAQGVVRLAEAVAFALAAPSSASMQS